MEVEHKIDFFGWTGAKSRRVRGEGGEEMGLRERLSGEPAIIEEHLSGSVEM